MIRRQSNRSVVMVRHQIRCRRQTEEVQIKCECNRSTYRKKISYPAMTHRVRGKAFSEKVGWKITV